MNEDLRHHETQVAPSAGATDQAFAHLLPQLADLLAKTRHEPQKLCASLDALAQTNGLVVYQELLFMISHLRFEPGEALEHWRSVVELQQTFAKALGRPIDLRAALVSYFVDVNHQLDNPKVIELRLYQKTEASAYRDGLTGLFNYRYCEEELQREIRRNERFSRHFSLMLIDIDDFKQLNDAHGHVAGNSVLVAVARVLSGSVRSVDTAARFGGEEFVLILPETAKVGAAKVAERVRAAIEQMRVAVPVTAEPLQTTVSIGLSSYPVDGLDAAELLGSADTAMYVAKRRGKNCVTLHGEDRRTYRRFRVALQGTVRRLGEESLEIKTFDLSEGGLSFTIKHEVTPGPVLDLRLQLSAATSVRCAVRVVRVRQNEEGVFECGARIIEMDQADWQELRKFARGGKD